MISVSIQIIPVKILLRNLLNNFCQTFTCNANVSSPTTSCSTCSIDICEGIFSCFADIMRRSVVFPSPFLPTRPYRLPHASTKSAPCSNTLKVDFRYYEPPCLPLYLPSVWHSLYLDRDLCRTEGKYTFTCSKCHNTFHKDVKKQKWMDSENSNNLICI